MPPPSEPAIKRAVAFFDGQNLFYHAKAAFGHNYPNYDPKKLFNALCQQYNWENKGIRFYTGIPDPKKDPKRHAFWSRRFLIMSRAGILVTQRTLRYAETITPLPDGSTIAKDVAREKGIDIRIALDIIRLCLSNAFDVGVIFSQDQDFAEVAYEIKDIAKSQSRWLKLYSAYPFSPKASCTVGIHNTEWIKMGEALYNACLDTKDYRSKS